MSEGFICRNDAGNVIVSDTSSSMYFIRKGTIVGTTGGSYYSRVALQTATQYVFDLGATLSFPIVFAYCATGIYAVLRVYAYGAGYRADVLARDNAAPPELYVFAKKNEYSGTDKYGVRVIGANGASTYDSRNGKILNMRTFQPATFAPNDLPLVALPQTYSYYKSKGVYRDDYYYNMESLNTNRTTAISIPSTTKPAVAINTLAICTRMSNYNEYLYYYDGYGTEQYIYYYGYAVYRGGMRIDATTQVSLCWVPHRYTETFKYTTVGGIAWSAPGGYEGGSGGNPPYSNQSLNLSGGTLSVIDASQYD